MADSTPSPCLIRWGVLVNSLRVAQASARLLGIGGRVYQPFDLLTSLCQVTRLLEGGLVSMARHLHHWIEMVEALLIIGILLAIAWVTWQALTQAYSPVFNLFNKF